MSNYEVTFRDGGIKCRMRCAGYSFDDARKFVLKSYPNAKIIFIENLFPDTDEIIV